MKQLLKLLTLRGGLPITADADGRLERRARVWMAAPKDAHEAGLPASWRSRFVD